MKPKKPRKPKKKNKPVKEKLVGLTAGERIKLFRKLVEVKPEKLNAIVDKFHFKIEGMGKAELAIRKTPVPHAVLLHLEVEKAFRATPGKKGLGVGGFLLENACDYARQKGAKFMVLAAYWNELRAGKKFAVGEAHPAHFYEKHGFKPIRESGRMIPEKIAKGEMVSVVKDLVPGDEKLKFRVLKHLQRRTRPQVRKLERKERKEKKKARKAASKKKE